MRKKRTSRPGAERAASKPRPSGDTRLDLLRAAERLMAERGIDAVSLREVSAAAGAGNHSAVAYHFGTRDALIDGILARHSAPIHERWDAQLDLLERQGCNTLRPYVDMLVREIVAKLDDRDGGWEYLSVAGQLLVTPKNALTEREVTQTAPVLRLIGAMMPFCPLPFELVPQRFTLVVSTIYTSVIAWHRAQAAGTLPVHRDVLLSDLVDAACALIVQPPSDETRAHLAAHTTPSE